MSIWTHVAGLIRIDCLPPPIGPVDEIVDQALRDAFGNTFVYQDPKDAWDACNVPCGSEGSVQYSIGRTRHEKSMSMSWGVVAVYGDLRDYEDLDAIYQWIWDSTKKLFPQGIGVRAVAVKLECEDRRAGIVMTNRSNDLVFIEV